MFRSFLALIIALFLTATAGVEAVYAQVGPPPPVPESVSYLIRNGSASISGTQTLANSGDTIDITPDSGTTSPITASARSVISVLRDIAASDPSLFSISHTGFSDFGTPYAGGLYIKCASVSGATVNPSCDNWQYQVNNVSPAVGVGITTVADTDSIVLYFGPSRRITPSSASVAVGTPFTVTAESYVSSSDSWTPAVGFTMRILQGDPFGSPTIISSATTGADGTAAFTINTAGSYTAGLAEDFYFPNAAITASSGAAPAPSGGGGGGSVSLHAPFDVPLALTFLEQAQHADGSFDSLLLSDWAAIAFAGGGAGDAQKRLAQYFSANPPALQSTSDFERHAMALQALGINPYSGTSVDYIIPIVKSFDESQIGDPSLVNDDVFAIFPLLHAGYTGDDLVIRKAVSFIVSKQFANGSWENSVDMTAAAISALSLTKQLPDVETAITSATNYLRAQKQPDGGFKNSFSTSWVLQAISALSESPSNWSTGYFSPQYYLATLQQTDGGVEPASASMNTRVWATAYAIPGISGKTWNSLLSSFGLPVVQTAPVQIATTTPVVATGTVIVADTAPVVPQKAVAKTKPPAEPEDVPEAAIPEDTPVVLPESTSPPEADPQPEASKAPPTETPATTQVAAVATVSANLLEWLLALLLLILIAILIVRILKHRSRNRHTSQSV